MNRSLSELKSMWKEKWKGINREQLLILLLVGLLLVVVTIPAEEKETAVYPEETRTKGDEGRSSEEGESYEQQQEKRLQEVLEQVEGVGRVQVMLTLRTSAEKVVEKDQPSASQSIEEQDSSGGSRLTREESVEEETVFGEAENGERLPYVVKEIEPQVEGVLIIAEGGGNAQIKQEILEAVQALFPVEAHKIKIMKMEVSK